MRLHGLHHKPSEKTFVSPRCFALEPLVVFHVKNPAQKATRKGK